MRFREDIHPSLPNNLSDESLTSNDLIEPPSPQIGHPSLKNRQRHDSVRIIDA